MIEVLPRTHKNMIDAWAVDVLQLIEFVSRAVNL